MVLCGFTGGSPSGADVLGDGAGPTVGNRPDGSPAETPVPVPDSGGSVTGGSVTPPAGVVVVGDVAGLVTTTSVAESVYDSALVADARAVSWTCSPGDAWLPTRTLT